MVLGSVIVMRWLFMRRRRAHYSRLAPPPPPRILRDSSASASASFSIACFLARRWAFLTTMRSAEAFTHSPYRKKGSSPHLPPWKHPQSKPLCLLLFSPSNKHLYLALKARNGTWLSARTTCDSNRPVVDNFERLQTHKHWLYSGIVS